MGKLYVVEGPDGSGKTSTAKLLSERLGAQRLQFPGDFWKRPKHADPDEFYAQRAKEHSDLVSKALETGDVVAPRYAFSIPAIGFAYSGKRTPLPEGIRQPDVIIYTTASPEELKRRLHSRVQTGEKSRLSGHERDPERYSRLCQRYDELFEGDPRVIKVDNTGRRVEDIVDELMGQLKDKR